MNATELNSRGHHLKDEGRYAEAEQAYRRAAEAAPGWSAPWFNLGLICKILRRWEESAQYNERALRCEPVAEEAFWNLGIAATALGDWARAREAWRGYGIEIPDGEGPLNLDWGAVPIRLNPDGDGEVVWCDRLDPARALIRNVPRKESGFREGDVVLHDGEPRGQRKLNGEFVDVFDALQLLERSPRETFEARVRAGTQADIDALEHIGERSGVVVEDWSRTIRNLCKKCSEGVPHEAHAYEAPPWDADHRIGLSAKSQDQASRVLLEWASSAPSREVL